MLDVKPVSAHPYTNVENMYNIEKKDHNGSYNLQERDIAKLMQAI